MSGVEQHIAKNAAGDALRDGHENGLVFIKLGGSLVSDKTEKETLRGDVLARISRYNRTILLHVLYQPCAPVSP